MWKQSSRFTLSYGMRWEPASAPSSDATPDARLWNTTYGNFAPRAGFAYQLIDYNKGDFLLRGGVNVFYDHGQDRSGDVFTNSIPFISGSAVLSSSTTQSLPLLSFDPHLKLPYSINWNVVLEKSVGSAQYVNVAYLASSGKRLLHTETLFDQDPDFPFLRLTTNRASSDYRALNVTFGRRMRDGFAALVSYTWSRSTDNAIRDSDRSIIMTSANPELDFGPSDFDREHELTGFLSYDLPAPFSKGPGNKLLRNWHVDSIVSARSAKPHEVYLIFPTSIGVAYFRPDGVSRNSSRGFPFYQTDLALRRKFNFTDEFGLQVQTDAFNLFNHSNFEDPLGNDLVLGSQLRPNSAFGQLTSLAGRGLWGGGFGSFYDRGGARTLRFSLKLVF